MSRRIVALCGLFFFGGSHLACTGGVTGTPGDDSGVAGDGSVPGEDTGSLPIDDGGAIDADASPRVDGGYPTTIVDALFGADADFGDSFIDVDGSRFGAEGDDLGPIGGGPGYLGGVETSACDVTVASGDALIGALGAATSGDVICVDGTAELDFTTLIEGGDAVELPGGVTLASDRGREGSLGAVLGSSAVDTPVLIRVTGPGARITGIRLRGPDPDRREEHWCEAFCADGPMLGSAHYYTIPNSRGIRVESDRLEVDNCEVAGFSHVGVFLVAGTGHHIHHSFLHHNQRKGLGYGVTHDGAFSVIERNIFDFNRHSIAGTGNPDSGYEARHNVVRGHSIGHNFDMHGGRDRGDGTNIAGSYTRVLNNTFFEIPGEQLFRAVRIRGIPEESNLIDSNWFAHTGPSAAIGELGGTVVLDNAYGMPTPEIVTGL